MPTSFVSTPCCASACSRTWPGGLDGGLVDLVAAQAVQQVGRRELPRRALHRRAELDLELLGLARARRAPGSCTFGLRGAAACAPEVRRLGPSASSRSMRSSASWSKSAHPVRRRQGRRRARRGCRRRAWRRRRARAPAGRVAAAVLSAADAHRHAGEHHEAGQHEGAEDEAGAPRARCPAASGPAAATPSRPPASTSSSVGASSPGRPSVRWSSPQPPIAIISPPTQRYDCEASSAVRRRRPRTPRTSTMPSATSADRHDQPAPADDHADARVEARARPGRRRRRTRPCRPRSRRAMQSRPTTSPAWLPSAGRQAAGQPVDEGRRRRRLLPGRRALRAPTPGPLGRSHSGHNRTSGHIRHKDTTTSVRRFPSPCDVLPPQTLGGQRFRWQVGAVAWCPGRR